MRWARAILVIFFLARFAAAQDLPSFDFKDSAAAKNWQPNKQISNLETTPDGLSITSIGDDPFLTGPERDYPPDQLLWLTMKIKSEKGGIAQVFYFEHGPREKNSVRTALRPGQWETLKLPLPPLGPRCRLRIDAPADGKTILAHVAFEPRDTLKPPENWPAPTQQPGKFLSFQKGEIQVSHGNKLGQFLIALGNKTIAIGGNRGLICYVHDRKQKWIDLNRMPLTAIDADPESLTARARFTDDDNCQWVIEQKFSTPVALPGIGVETTIVTTKDRAVAYLPILFLHPGVGSFGEKKQQAIFPGLEYLDKNEPSSSEADLIGPGSQRQVPDSAKITIPMMAIAANDSYIGLIWEPSELLSAVFDSPDRLYKSGGHVIGLICPGSNPDFRSEGNLMPSDTIMLRADKPISFKATIIAGRGQTIVPALQDYLAIRGLPKIPNTNLDLAGYVQLASAGWLDSQIGADGLFRHAFPGPFNPHPAADAVAMLDWLQSRSADEPLRSRLAASRKSGLVKLGNGANSTSTIGHIKTPAPALLFGNLEQESDRALQHGRDLLKRFDAFGSAPYKQSGTINYARTHFAPDANGLTANLVANILSAGAFSGDRVLIAEGLRLLRALNKFDHTVPRGAQTWEIPLHTPDVLAAAHLVRVYTLGYQLSGDKTLLDRAEYWAWTGVPFVYLHNPTAQPIGPYATIAVLGATNWEAPNWMGLPVQWCGLVYADALYQLAPFAPRGPWKDLADGITASGIQQTWPADSDAQRRGLLPDSFMPRQQQRVDVCINPATLQIPAARFYRQTPFYSLYARKHLLIHIPGEIIKEEQEKDALFLRIRPFTTAPYSILICGLKSKPRVTINSAPPTADAARYLADRGRLIIKLQGESTVLLEDL